MDVESMQLIDDYLKSEFQLMYVDAKNRKNRIFHGKEGESTLFQFVNNHLNAITGEMKGYIEFRVICVRYWILFDNRNLHNCPESCLCCHRFLACKMEGQKIEC